MNETSRTGEGGGESHAWLSGFSQACTNISLKPRGLDDQIKIFLFRIKNEILQIPELLVFVLCC